MAGRLSPADVDSRPWPSLAAAVVYARTLEGAGWRVDSYDPARPDTHPLRGDGTRVLARVITPGPDGGLVGEVTYQPPGLDPGA